MRRSVRVVIGAIAGIAVGTGSALYAVRAGALGAQTRIGPWATGRDFGTARASAYTRAVVALGGLLALPASEARYYTAATDDAGRPLDGRCRYRLTGGTIPARWWSVTLYDAKGYLVANPAGRYSVGSIGLPPAAAARWTIQVAPARLPGVDAKRWLPTGKVDRFQLTLRAYLPGDYGVGDLARAQLPTIARIGCA